MILCEWDAPDGNPNNVAYTCMLSYPIIVSHLPFNFLCLLLLYSFYLCGSYLAESTLWKSALLVSLLSVQDFTKTSFSNLMEQMEGKVQLKHFYKNQSKNSSSVPRLSNGATFVPVSETGFVKARNLSSCFPCRFQNGGLVRRNRTFFVCAKVKK
jgi:hypothetical protein